MVKFVAYLHGRGACALVKEELSPMMENEAWAPCGCVTAAGGNWIVSASECPVAARWLAEKVPAYDYAIVAGEAPPERLLFATDCSICVDDVAGGIEARALLRTISERRILSALLQSLNEDRDVF